MASLVNIPYRLEDKHDVEETVIFRCVHFVLILSLQIPLAQLNGFGKCVDWSNSTVDQ